MTFCYRVALHDKLIRYKGNMYQMSQKKCGVENFNILRIVPYINAIFCDMVTFIQLCANFQSNISKVTEVMAARGMMGEKGVG